MEEWGGWDGGCLPIHFASQLLRDVLSIVSGQREAPYSETVTPIEGVAQLVDL